MRLLLDTHAFLWWDMQNDRLNDDVAALIADAANEVFISAASVWEIAIKRRRGKLVFQGSPVTAIAANDFLELPILPLDAEAAGSLDWSHNDPFDRLLIVQAQRLNLTLVTSDTVMRTYDGLDQVWAG